jgi:hypothetical protein
MNIVGFSPKKPFSYQGISFEVRRADTPGLAPYGAPENVVDFFTASGWAEQSTLLPEWSYEDLTLTCGAHTQTMKSEDAYHAKH